MAEKLLRVDGLTKTFSTGFLQKGMETQAVKAISFEHESGSILGLIGESGSGKTTTARLIARLIKPDDGNIFLKSRSIWSIPTTEYYRQMQLLFQDPYSSFNPVYVVKHSFDSAFKKLFHVSKEEQEKRILEVLSMVRLIPEEILGKYPHELSGGQLQRAALARVLMINPDLLIVDEPTSMVDASLRITILNILLNMVRQIGTSIIFITHDISQAYYVCDRIAIMYRGEIVEEGPVEEVISNPKHDYSKRLIADVPKMDKRYETLVS